MATTIVLGRPHPLVTDRLLREGATVSLTPENFGMLEVLRNPTMHEVVWRQNRQFEIGLVDGYRHTLFFILHCGPGTAWAELPFALGVLPPDYRDVPAPLVASSGYLIHYELIDLVTHVVMAMRAFTVSPQFSALLQAEVDKLRMNLADFTLERHHAEVADYCEKHPLERRPEDALIIETAGALFPTIN